MATALYRRYRPEAFSEMIGQAHVTEPLMTALRTGRIGHAYLFSGPRGCGKTTSARILARCLNCAEGPTDTPCGTCPSCVELSRDGGGSLDVVEIDAASHGGVDDARDLRERAVFAPARDRYKIFIIDEAHMVTAGGFNALLKIVEEPPPHIKFIFATTEPEKVIGTIRSRTHHYPFRLIAPGALIDYVQQLCDSEGVDIEPGVLPLVVRSGGGSVRDTLSILDQLIAGSEQGAVSLVRATGLLGFTSTELLDEIVGALGAGDSAAAFAATDRVVQTGQDPRRFVEDLLERLRDLIVISATTVQGASAVFRGVPDDQLQRMFEQAQVFAPGQLSRIADTVSGALDGMTGATAPRLHLELMVARALVGAAQQQAAARPGGAQPAPAQATPAQATPAHQTPAQPLPTQHQPGQPQPAQAQPVQSQQAPGQRTQTQQTQTQQTQTQQSAPTLDARGPSQPPQSAAASAAPAVDVLATMRSARDFLNSDSAGTGRPPIVPLGGHPAPASAAPAADGGPADGAAPAAGVAAEPAADGSGTAPDRSESAPVQSEASPAPQEPAPSEAGAASPVGFDELQGVWREVLEELLEGDREAWNAVKAVQPLSLDGEVLAVGVASRSDLEAFKVSGAGPLREALEAALGITVKYVPRQIPAAQAAPREPQPTDASDEEPSPQAEPAQAPLARREPGYSEPELSEPPAAAWAEPENRRPEPEEAAPAPAVTEQSGPARGEFGDPGFTPDRDPYEDPAYSDDLGELDDAYAGTAPNPEPVTRDPESTAPETETESESEPEPELRASDSEPQVPDSGPQASEPEPEASEPAQSGVQAPARQSAPSFSRYGEAVIREVLGARFIEERPLPQEER